MTSSGHGKKLHVGGKNGVRDSTVALFSNPTKAFKKCLIKSSYGLKTTRKLQQRRAGEFSSLSAADLSWIDLN